MNPLVREFVNNRRGVALVMVLWITALLAVMAGVFTSIVRSEARGLANYKMQTEAYYKAIGGLNLAASEILNKSALASRGGPENPARWIFDGRPNSVRIDGALVEVKVFDESGRIDINKASRLDLQRILMAAGVKGADRDTIADSIADWIDKNSFHRLNGAEDDYYKELPDHYEAKDGPLDTVDELLWIRGITPEIFYGPDKENFKDNKEGDEAGRPLGLQKIFTVRTGSVRVNLNTAPIEVLLTLPGFDMDKAGRLIDFREREDIDNMSVLANITGGLKPGISKYVTFKSSGLYTILSTVKMDDTPVRYTLKAVIKAANDSFEILYWKDRVYNLRPI